jgi:hypothetical protein
MVPGHTHKTVAEGVPVLSSRNLALKATILFIATEQA